MSIKDAWVNKMWSICTRKYYSAINRNEIQIHATVRMNLENVIISERRQMQNAKYYKILFIWNVHKTQIHRDRKQVCGGQGLRGWGTRNAYWWIWAFFLRWCKMSWNGKGRVVAQFYEHTKTTESYTLKDELWRQWIIPQ